MEINEFSGEGGKVFDVKGDGLIGERNLMVEAWNL